MNTRKSLLQWGGFVVVAAAVLLFLTGPVGILDSALIGAVLAYLYLPIFNYFYNRQMGPRPGAALPSERDEDKQAAKVTVKHSRISRGSSIGMMLLGVITLLFVSGLLGLILIAIGGVMYWFYRRQSKVSQGGVETRIEKGAAL